MINAGAEGDVMTDEKAIANKFTVINMGTDVSGKFYSYVQKDSVILLIPGGTDQKQPVKSSGAFHI